MRIGIDCRLWDETGVGRYIRNLVEQLLISDQKNDYTLFVLSKDYGKFKVQSSKFKVRVADIRWHTLEEQVKFPQILNKENLDIVHFPYFSVPIFYNRPFVVTIHDLIINHFPTGKASRLPFPIYNLKLLAYKYVMREAVKKAKKIIAVSNATKREIMDHFGVRQNKIAVTYEGIEDALSSKLKTQNSKLQLKSQKYFLYVGNAYPHKNLERLIEAFSFFCHPEASAEGSRSDRDPDLHQNDTRLVLVGREDYFYKKLKEKVNAMGLKESVIFYSEAKDDELSNLYKNALALIMPSLMEGFGLPALEAMANHCLVLASDISSLREVCANAAIYFDPFNVRELAEKMKSILLNDLNHFSEKKEKGLKRAKLFSWQKMTKDTLRVYEETGAK